jgi:hypothetical protein
MDRRPVSGTTIYHHVIPVAALVMTPISDHESAPHHGGHFSSYATDGYCRRNQPADLLDLFFYIEITFHK